MTELALHTKEQELAFPYDRVFFVGGAIAIASLFVLLWGDAVSAAVYLLASVSGLFTLHLIQRYLLRTRDDHKNAYSVAYLIISFFGVAILWDDYSNFGSYFGEGGDDYKYWLGTVNMMAGRENTASIMYSLGLSPIAYPISLLTDGDAHIRNLLPINWMWGALVFSLSIALVKEIVGKTGPLWIYVVALILNFTFLDTMAHLYRDSLLMLFFLLTILLIFKNRYAVASLFFAMSTVLRGANGALLMMAGGLRVFANQRKKWTFALVAVIFMGAAISYVGFDQIAGTILRYATDVTRAERRNKIFRKFTAEELFEFNQKMNNSFVAEGSLLAKINNGNKYVAIAAKPVLTLVFPFTIRPFEDTRQSYSVMAVRPKVRGYFLSHGMLFLTICALGFAVPFIGYGLIKALGGTNKEQAMALFYILALTMVANISGQMRHNLGCIVMTPIFVTLAWDSYVKKPFARNLLNFGMFSMVALLILWNLSKFVKG